MKPRKKVQKTGEQQSQQQKQPAKQRTVWKKVGKFKNEESRLGEDEFGNLSDATSADIETKITSALEEIGSDIYSANWYTTVCNGEKESGTTLRTVSALNFFL